MSNRLATESSPYLLQHADNPVAWWPWGTEAFAEATRLDKPVFVSIGYAACHWCHVMAHESFEDPTIAALMNELFINVKVDREERPDVDAIYMNAIQVMGEGGGWPLSAFCTPDGKPFYLGTYFPPQDRYGRPSFTKLLNAMAEAYARDRGKVMENVEALLEGLRQVDEHYRKGATAADPSALSKSLLVTAGRQLAQRTDSEHGGLGGAPKFPSTSTHELLGRCGRLGFGKPAREAYLLWARKMARGGIYDHLGGGFARYAVDAIWLVPHFEKMLYDNGQLLSVYADVLALGEDAAVARAVIAETVGWLEREMSDAAGGLYASQDADSEGEEGKFYVWTPAEVRAVLGPIDAIHFSKAFGVTDAGNFEHARTVLSRITPLGPASDEAALDEARAKLFAARSTRIPPATDTKVLAGWNGLAVIGLVRAAATSEAARALALRVGEFLATRMMHGDRLWRVFKDGVTKLDGTLDDYAFVAAAFLDLAELTGDAAWWQRGVTLMATVRARFYEERDGVGIFYMTAHDVDDGLIHRPESHHDGAIPSGAAVAVDVLLRLALVTGEPGAEAIAERYLVQRLGGAAGVSAFAASKLLSALDRYLHGQVLVVSDGAGREELIAAARAAYAPVLSVAGPWAAPSILEGKVARDGKALAYVCRGQSCSAPVGSAEELVALLTAEP